MDANNRLSRASDEAADWWALLQGGGMSREERSAFIDWLRDSQTNIAEMLRLSQVHGALAQFKEWDAISTDGSRDEVDIVSWPADRSDHIGRDRHRPGAGAANLKRLALGAPLAAAVVAVVFFLGPWRGQSIVTERGQRLEVVLEDGSSVQVDPETHLRVRFDQVQRRIALNQGRAVFHVAKDATRPFVVEADGMSVRAVGTAFGVDRRNAGVLVITVAEGKVALSTKAVDKQSRANAPIYLVANQQVVVEDRKAKPVHSVIIERELAWAEGRLVFKNDPVSKLVAEFNRYNHVQLVVTDPTLAARPVTGVFNATNPEGLLAFLENTASVHIERNAGQSIVISAGSASSR